MIDRMKPPTFIRPVTPEERQALRSGLRSPDAFTLRRCQILLASADGLRPAQIAARFGCASQTVRNTIAAFAAEAAGCLRPKSHRPKSARPVLEADQVERLRALLHRSPRDFGQPAGVWTLALAAEVAHRTGLTPRRISGEMIRQALKRRGFNWKRAKHWSTSPDPAYARKKGRATG